MAKARKQPASDQLGDDVVGSTRAASGVDRETEEHAQKTFRLQLDPNWKQSDAERPIDVPALLARVQRQLGRGSRATRSRRPPPD